jgi:hypothetical protein
LEHFNFDLRSKKDAIVSYKTTSAKPKSWFANLKKGQGSWLKRKVWIYGEQVYLVGIRLEKPTEDGDEFVFVVTNACSKAALGLYSYSWGIENLFQALKTRGFNFEATMPVRCVLWSRSDLSALCSSIKESTVVVNDSVVLGVSDG